MYKLLTMLWIFFIITTGVAQPKDIDEVIVRTIADAILAETTTGYQAVGSRATNNSIKDIPEGVEVQFRDHFTEWGYLMGSLDDCGAMAASLIEVYQTGKFFPFLRSPYFVLQ
jgi:hypothetical protein